MGKTVEPLTGERQSKESKNSILACNDYLRMGAGRSLRGLVAKYQQLLHDSDTKPPVTTMKTVGKWSATYGWVKRAETYDAFIEDEKNAMAEEMMRSGLALDYERVGELKDMFELLMGELTETNESGVMHNLWLPDVKAVGGERVDIERYNSPLVGDIRGLLDDLAKETGGRVHKQEIETKNKTYNVTVENPLDE